MRPHVDAIAANLAEWPDPMVERAIFGTVDPRAIAQTIGAFCRMNLGSDVAAALFARTSVGSVHGLVLADGRRVVLKALADGAATRLHNLLESAARLADHGLPLPRPLLGPTPLGRGFAWVEAMLDGISLDVHVPGATTLLAGTLAELARASDVVRDLELPRMFLFADRDHLWPKPHSPLFDFATTSRGAEWIDEAATHVRAILARAEGQFVLGHHDIRVEHVRFDGDPPTRVVALYDVDSLCRERETFLVGTIAMMFCANWQERRRQAPTVEQMKTLVAEYERAREAPFSRREHEEIAAASTYAIAYTARCGHALAGDPDAAISGYAELLRELLEHQILPR